MRERRRARYLWNDVVSSFDSVEDKTERLLNDAKSLRDRVKSLSDEESIHAERSELIEKLDHMVDDVDRLYSKLQDDFRAAGNVKEGVMYGSNNPKIRAALEYGKRKHEEMQSSYSCDEKEVSLSSGRPDCVNFKPKDDCQVIEYAVHELDGKIRGPEWGTFLASDHLEPLGGAAAIVAGCGCEGIRRLRSGGMYLQLTARPPEPDAPALAAGLDRLRGFLAPVRA